jgi:chemotaxis signal transduction protein
MAPSAFSNPGLSGPDADDWLDEDSDELDDGEEQRARVMLKVGKLVLALPILEVLELLELPELTPMPGSPREVRGVTQLRGEVLTVLDLRVLLEQPSLVEETREQVASLQQRKKDHENWVAGLLDSVRTGVPFAGALDPTQCAFGKWKAQYQPENEELRAVLERMDEPHKRIHALAKEVLEIRRLKGVESAEARIEQARTTTLNRLMGFLDRLARMVESAMREVLVVVTDGEQRFAVTVDAVLGVERIDAEDGADAGGGQAAIAPRRGFVQRNGDAGLASLVQAGDWVRALPDLVS